MGRDKASIPVSGVAMARRIALRLQEAGIRPTVLGSEPIEDLPFQRDLNAHEGPLAALRHFKPEAVFVFVAACDLPHFDAGVVAVLKERLGDVHASVPSVEGRLQPLCALYRADALDQLAKPPLETARSMREFLDTLRVVEVPEAAFAGLHPHCLRSANSQEELEELLGEDAG